MRIPFRVVYEMEFSNTSRKILPEKWEIFFPAHWKDKVHVVIRM